MILFADRVLRDCEIALEVLEANQDQKYWQVHWVGAVALIRTVGHVLRQRDRKIFPEVAEKIDAAFARWKIDDEHVIFRDFIEQERNWLLKEYRSSINELPVILVTDKAQPKQKPVMWNPNEDGSYTPLYAVKDRVHHPRLTGFMAGEDARDLYRAAIDWWHCQLNGIAGR